MRACWSCAASVQARVLGIFRRARVYGPRVRFDAGSCVNILDENIPENQRQLLRSWRMGMRQIGYEVGRQGLKDREIILVAHRRHSGDVNRLGKTALGMQAWSTPERTGLTWWRA